MSKHFSRLFVILFASLLLVGGYTNSASAKQENQEVNGQVTTNFYNANCPSPIGICGMGPISGGLNGMLNAVLTSQKETRKKGVLISTYYKGYVTIKTDHGILEGSISTTINETTQAVSAKIHIKHGTGSYNGAHGILNLTGQGSRNSGATEDYRYSGWLKYGEDHESDD